MSRVCEFCGKGPSSSSGSPSSAGSLETLPMDFSIAEQSGVEFIYGTPEDNVFTMLYEPVADANVQAALGLCIPAGYDSDPTGETDTSIDYAIYDYQTGDVCATVTVQTSNGLQASCKVVVPEVQWRLYVWLNDGTYGAFDLEKHPEISLNGDRLVVDAEATQLEYAVDDVARITMADAAVFDPQDGLVVPVQAVAAADNAPRFRAGQLSLSNLPAGSRVRIYNGAGMLLHQAVADDRGQLSLSATRFGKGLLIVKTETSTFKILQQ